MTTTTELRSRVLNGVFRRDRYPNDLDALFDEAAEVMGMNDPSIPKEAEKFVRRLAEAQAHRAAENSGRCMPMLAAIDNYYNFAEEILKIVNAVHASYDL